jgi:hypothetical protein
MDRQSWFGWALGALLIVAIGAVVITALRHHGNAVPKVIVGANDQVYYRGASMQQATALGHALQNVGFFNDRGTSVMLSRSKGVPGVSFVLNDGAWDHPDTIASFEEIGRRVAASIGGFPILVHLTDSAWTVRRSLTIGRTTAGAHDVIYYFGSTTPADAQALAAALRQAGYLQDLGVTITIAKANGTAIGFVVGDGVWDQPQAVAAFEQLVRRVAPSAGGLPIELKLLNAEMELKKDVEVR